MATPQKSAATHARIRELDGLRGICVILVVLCHLYEYSHALTWPSFLQPANRYMGLLGVRTFFVISGFIITSLQLEEQRLTGKVHLLKFYLRRFFRIIPAYWTYLTVVLILAAMGGISQSGWCITPSLLFIRNVWLIPPE